MTNFSLIDFVIVIAYLSFSMWLGLKARHNISSMKDYVTADQRLGKWLGIASIGGTEMGLITIMYSAQKGFTGGFAAFHIALIAGIVTFLVGISGFIISPLRETGVLTIPEYYEKRFSVHTRILGGIMLAFGGILNMGLFLKVGAQFLQTVTGFSSDSLAVPIIMTILIVLVLIYTVLGGMMSVVVTDYLQYVLMSFSLLMLVFISLNKLGWTQLFAVVDFGMGEAGVNPLISENGFGLSYMLWMVVTAGLVSCAIWPTAIARVLSAKSSDIVKKQYMWSSISFMIRFLIPYFLGICAYVYFFGENVNSLTAMPMYLSRVVPSGMLGLITAGMLAAFMSTHDSYLLCFSSVISHDIINPLKKVSLTDTQKIRITKIIVCLIGVYVWYWGLFYKGSEDIWDYMAITGAIYFTGAIAVLIGGLYWKRTSTWGANAALIAGCTALLGLEPVKHFFHLTQYTGANIGLFTVTVSFLALIVGTLIENILKPKKIEV